MDRYEVTVQQLHMVSLSCLILASKFGSATTALKPNAPGAWCMVWHLLVGKFEEREDRVPKLETLNGLGCMSSMNLVLTKQGLLHMELLLLETFQWNLYLPTAAHFIDYYLSIAVHEGDLHDGWPMTCLEKTKVYMAKYADYFLEVSLQGKIHNHVDCVGRSEGQVLKQSSMKEKTSRTCEVDNSLLHSAEIDFSQ